MREENNIEVITITVSVGRMDKKPISKEMLENIKDEILLRCEDGYLYLTDPEESVLDEDDETIEGEEYEVWFQFPML